MDREVGRVAADPDEADLAGDRRGGLGRRPDDRRRPLVEKAAGWFVGVAVDLVGLEEADPSRRRRRSRRSGTAVGLVPEAGVTGRLVMTLLTMILVPANCGSPRLTVNWSFWPSALSVLASGSVPKKAVVSTPPKSSGRDAVGDGDRGLGPAVGRGRGGRRGEAQVEVGHVDRRGGRRRSAVHDR